MVLAQRAGSYCQPRQALPPAGEEAVRGQLGRRWSGLKNPQPLRGPGQQLLGSYDKGPTCLFNSHFLNVYSRPVPVLHTGIKEKNETWAMT